MITKKDKNVQFSEYAGHFSNQVNNADTLRTESLQRLHKIRGKRQKNQQRQLIRLAIRFGERHPRVLRQAERIVNEKDMENYLSVSISKAEVETEITKDSFIVQGHVFDDNIKALSGLKVQLQDTQNNVLGTPVKTDSEGFYSITVGIEKEKKPRKINVVVLDKQNTQIHKDPLPVILKADSLETRDMVVTNIIKQKRDSNEIIKDVLTPGKTTTRKKVTVKSKIATKTTKKPKTRNTSKTKSTQKVTPKKLQEKK